MHLTETQLITPISAPTIDIGASLGQRVSSLFRHIARNLQANVPDPMLSSPYMLRDVGLVRDQIVDVLIADHRSFVWRL